MDSCVYTFLKSLAAVKCNPVNLINNGFIANAAECGRNEYGATCIFRCNAGFKLVGNDVLKCDHTGRFSGSLPQCVRKCIFYISHLVL